jgi:hypothetical protein
MTSVRTRSVVAIAAAIPVVPIISPEDELVNRRINGAIFELSAFILGTPAFSQAVLYRMLMDGEATIPNQEIVLPKIKEQWDLLLSVTSDLQQRYPEEAEIISGTVRAKWVNYTSYLRYVHEWLDHTPMALFTAVDRGQTSEGNRNTCMFNSIFSADLRLRNITSTKRNIIERARAYIAQLRAYYIPAYMETADDPLINDEDGIDEHLIRLDADRSADEEYGAGAEGALGRMVPGQIADCSAAEAQAHALGLNIMIFPKQKTGTGDTLASYFGTGYLGSEHFPVSAVSCSLWHAQSLIPRTVPA